ncbi:MAG: hypothetical protein COU31_05080 [Candidatus Magasanikbacteria bacterium CG10_big_fil_rev_8_21_14_0_10_40_10]|uniref:Glycosyltransferase 2-like domain-containing protein n=1 Tax=Candidatus Magasanikbacteria bacterium CG10_big_fil_rev_8_21_14_0_10_40_10 TaxID=1974648 RepID=A0A2M6W2U0_9BACT|nr:MAG: hypothetical protein COU31_05080 [Candidatus Magasanikbacteria bacterium CG10_big_fil_rev_8_21_14_0_10_40_10]
MSEIIFSIIVPAYNEEKYLGWCFRSLKKLEGDFVLEIIVVDNNSTDQTARIARQQKGVKLLFERRRGAGSARRLGTRFAQGKYILHIDADTCLPAGYLIQVKKIFDQDPSVACLGGQFYFYDAVRWQKIIRPLVYYPLMFFMRLVSGRKIGPAGNNMCFKKRIYDLTDGFDADIKLGEDMNICRQMSRHGKIKMFYGLKCFISSRRYRMRNLSYLVKIFFLVCFNKKIKSEYPHSQEL